MQNKNNKGIKYLIWVIDKPKKGDKHPTLLNNQP